MAGSMFPVLRHGTLLILGVVEDWERGYFISGAKVLTLSSVRYCDWRLCSRTDFSLSSRCSLISSTSSWILLLGEGKG